MLKTLAIFIFCVAAGNIAEPLRGEETTAAKGEVEGFVLEFPDQDGRSQGVLEGTKAVFDPNGTVKITEAKAKIFQKGKGTFVVVTSQALYHRSAKIVTTDRPVQVDSRDTHITGNGLVWEPDTQKILIQEKARVVLKNVPKE